MAYNHDNGDGDRIFAPVFADVWDEKLKNMNGADVKVYIALLMHTTSHDRTWYMSVDELSEDAGIARSTVSAAKDRLIEVGLITQSWRYRDESGDYHLTDTRPPPKMQGKNVYKVMVKTPLGDADNRNHVDADNRNHVDADNRNHVDADNRNQTIAPTTKPLPENQVGAAAPSAPGGDADEPHRIPNNWKPTPALWSRMRKKYPHLNLNDELQKFVTYWDANTTKQSMKKDWGRAWQNWLGKANTDTPRMTKTQQASRWADDILDSLGGVNDEPAPF